MILSGSDRSDVLGYTAAALDDEDEDEDLLLELLLELELEDEDGAAHPGGGGTWPGTAVRSQ